MHPNSGSDPQGWYHDEPHEVHVTRIDVPFLDLTWFFVKASLALAVACSVTSWLWVVIATGMITLSGGLLLLLGVPGWFAPEPAPAALVAPPTPPPVLVAPPPVAPPPAPVVEPEPEPEPEPVAEPPPVDPNQAATEAMQRAELERLRRERGR